MKARTHGSEPVYCRKSIKCCGVKMHSQPFSVSPRTLCTGRGETHREEEGASPRPQTAPAGGTARHTQLTSPRAFQGRPDARVRTPQTILGLSLCPAGQNGLGQSDSHGTSGHQGLCKATWEVCAPSVQEAGAGPVLGHVLPSPHPHASVPGAQRACGVLSTALEGMSGQQALVLCPRLRI